MTIDHVALFGGVPLANPAFQHARLLAATSVVRAAEAERNGVAVSGDDLFHPQQITGVRQQTLRQEIPSHDPSPGQLDAIDEALDLLERSLPHVAPLLEIPIRFRILSDSPAISASSFAWPQHVFLGADAFESPEQLTEQLTHELCHCWLYFMEEVAPVHTSSERVLRLPSGTSNRDAAEVLGALHVAVALQRLWAGLPVDPAPREDRVRALRSYADGCIELLRGEAAPFLTLGGARLVDDLVQIHHSMDGEVTAV